MAADGDPAVGSGRDALGVPPAGTHTPGAEATLELASASVTTVRLEPSYRMERRALGKALESEMQDSTRFMSITLPSGNVRIPGATWFDDRGISPDGRLRSAMQARVLHLTPPMVCREDAVFEVKLPVGFAKVRG